MSLRCLPGLALLVLAFSISTQAQSLGEIARQYRAERQRSAAPHARVITNDDIASPAPARPAKQVANEDAPDSTEAGNAPPRVKAAKPIASIKQEDQKSETDIRTEEINNRYLDRIAAIRKQLDAAQQELARLHKEQEASTFDYRRSLNTFPNPEVYENQQREFNAQIKTQSDLIATLNSQLEDAQEAARHAGVPHATD